MEAIIEREMVTAESGTLALLNKSEIDMQVATAHKYPRSISTFRRDVMDMVTVSEKVAQECIYALPRDGKVIEGPSARFAEVVASAWGNSRAGARVVSDSGDFVTAQGVFHDLQRNVAITYEVQRRIKDKNGRRFKPDMIGVTANAACSIALRNAILKGVPKAFWSEMYEGARQTALGDVKTLPTRRAEAFKAFQGYGVSKEQIIEKLGLNGEADIGQEQLLILRGLLTAIKDGDTTPEQAFGADGNGNGQAGRPELPGYTDDEFETKLKAWAQLIDNENNRTASTLLAKLSTRAKFTEEQRARILSLKPAPAAPADNATESFVAAMNAAEASHAGAK